MPDRTEAVRRRFAEVLSDLSDEPTAVNVARYLRASAALDRATKPPREAKAGTGAAAKSAA